MKRRARKKAIARFIREHNARCVAKRKRVLLFPEEADSFSRQLRHNLEFCLLWIYNKRCKLMFAREAETNYFKTVADGLNKIGPEVFKL